jgi:hypothetical protein
MDSQDVRVRVYGTTAIRRTDLEQAKYMDQEFNIGERPMSFVKRDKWLCDHALTTLQRNSAALQFPAVRHYDTCENSDDPSGGRGKSPVAAKVTTVH